MLRVGHAGLGVEVVALVVGLVEGNGLRVIGGVVDSVSDVLPLAGDQIRPAPEIRSGLDSGTLIGIGSVGQGAAQRMLILLDISALMGSAEMGLADAAFD